MHREQDRSRDCRRRHLESPQCGCAGPAPLAFPGTPVHQAFLRQTCPDPNQWTPAPIDPISPMPNPAVQDLENRNRVSGVAVNPNYLAGVF